MTKKPDAPLLADLLAHEERVWTALTMGDKNADDALLSAGFLGVYSDGFATKADHLEQLDQGPTIAAYNLSECHVKPLGPNHALLSYRAAFRRLSRDDTEAMFVSSIWERNKDGWINLFSQDTPEQRP